MGGLPGGRLLGILNPNSAHSNTTWPPDATVAVCVEPQAAPAGLAAPSRRHIASSDCNPPLIVPEPPPAAACAAVTTCCRAVPHSVPSRTVLVATSRTLPRFPPWTNPPSAPLPL